MLCGENGNHWLLTGWENNKETVAYAVGEGYDSSNATAAKPTPTRLDGVNVTVSSSEMIASDKENNQEQFSDTSQVQKQTNSINPTDFLNMTLDRRRYRLKAIRTEVRQWRQRLLIYKLIC